MHVWRLGLWLSWLHFYFSESSDAGTCIPEQKKNKINVLIEGTLEAKVLEGSYLTNSSLGLDGLFTNSSLTG